MVPSRLRSEIGRRTLQMRPLRASEGTVNATTPPNRTDFQSGALTGRHRPPARRRACVVKLLRQNYLATASRQSGLG